MAERGKLDGQGIDVTAQAVVLGVKMSEGCVGG